MKFIPESCMDLVAMKPVGRTKWSKDLLVDIPEMDEDHRRFVSLADDLDSALITCKDKSEIRRLMSLIVEDAVQHFEHEERLFAQYGYPDAVFHASMHAQIVDELMKVKQQFDSADLSVEWIANGFNIRYLLMDHLLEQDMKYRDFVRDRRQTSY